MIGRIRNRAQPHAIKHRHSDGAREFLSRYRSSYDHVMSKLTRVPGPRILRFDTDRQSIAEITAQVFETVDSSHPELSRPGELVP